MPDGEEAVLVRDQGIGGDEAQEFIHVEVGADLFAEVVVAAAIDEPDELDDALGFLLGRLVLGLIAILVARPFFAEVLDAALPVARQVPDGAPRQREGSAFAPGLPVPPGSGSLEEILALLGRSPTWPA